MNALLRLASAVQTALKCLRERGYLNVLSFPQTMVAPVRRPALVVRPGRHSLCGTAQANTHASNPNHVQIRDLLLAMFSCLPSVVGQQLSVRGGLSVAKNPCECKECRGNKRPGRAALPCFGEHERLCQAGLRGTCVRARPSTLTI